MDPSNQFQVNIQKGFKKIVKAQCQCNSRIILGFDKLCMRLYDAFETRVNAQIISFEK